MWHHLPSSASSVTLASYPRQACILQDIFQSLLLAWNSLLLDTCKIPILFSFMSINVTFTKRNLLVTILKFRQLSTPSSCVLTSSSCMYMLSDSVTSHSVALWSADHQGPLSMAFPRQEHWRGLPFLPQGIFLNQGSNPHLLCILCEVFTTEPPGKPSTSSWLMLSISCNAGDPGSMLGSGRFPGEGHGNPLQCSCLKNYTDSGVWQTPIHGVTKSQTRRSNQHIHHLHGTP